MGYLLHQHGHSPKTNGLANSDPHEIENDIFVLSILKITLSILMQGIPTGVDFSVERTTNLEITEFSPSKTLEFRSSLHIKQLFLLNLPLKN